MKPLKITYKLEFSEFSDYNNLLAGEIVAKSKKKVTTCGIFEIIFSCALFLYTFILGKNDLMLFILALSLFFVGVFCTMFYGVFFEIQLKRSIAKEYNTNPYFSHNTTLTFTEEGIQETNKVGKGFTEYHQLGESVIYNDLLIIKLTETNGFAIPLRAMDEETKQQVKEILIQKTGDLVKF